MNRDLSHIKRDLEDRKNNDIIWRKSVIKEALESDPDILEILGKKDKRPKNKYKDPSNPTEEELEIRKGIEAYNEKVSKDQIIPFLKLNGIQEEVLNFIMFDIKDDSVSYTNNVIKKQQLIVMCIVSEEDMDTEYGIMRADLLSYLVKDILCWSDVTGMQMKMIEDSPRIMDNRYYCRSITFEIMATNEVRYGNPNRYDSR